MVPLENRTQHQTTDVPKTTVFKIQNLECSTNFIVEFDKFYNLYLPANTVKVPQLTQ